MFGTKCPSITSTWITVPPPALGSGNFIRQVGKIGRQNRWKQLNHRTLGVQDFGLIPCTVSVSAGQAPVCDLREKAGSLTACCWANCGFPRSGVPTDGSLSVGGGPDAGTWDRMNSTCEITWSEALGNRGGLFDWANKNPPHPRRIALIGHRPSASGKKISPVRRASGL